MFERIHVFSFAYFSCVLTTSGSILWAQGWAGVFWSDAVICSLNDLSANIRLSSSLPLSISEELLCHVFSLSSTFPRIKDL